MLKLLSVENPAPVLKDGSRWVRTPVLYQMDHEKIQRLTSQRVEEWEKLQGYIDSENCLMLYLAESLDDENPAPCGKCARCLGAPIIPETYATSLAVDAALFLKHSEFPLVCNKQVAKDAFVEYGFRGNLPIDDRAETGRILSRWG